MKIASVANIKAHLSAYLKQCEDGPVIITKNGKPVAVLITALDDEEDLERLVLAHTPRFRHLLDDAKERIQQTGGIEHEDFWKLIEENDHATSRESQD